MDRRIITLLSLLSLAAGHGLWAAPPVANAEPVSHLLDGRTFYGRERVKGGEERNQVYIFRDGTFEARWWVTAGLHAGPYIARMEGDAILFDAETPGALAEAGPARWQGRVVGDHIEVTGVVQRQNGPPIEVAGRADLGERVRDRILLEQELELARKLPAPGTPEAEQALQRSLQNRTVADISNLATALVSWLADQVPKPDLTGTDPGKVVDLQAYRPVTAGLLRQMLVPKYLSEIPATDGWGHPIEMRLNMKALQGKHVMCLRSPGHDGRFSGESYKVGTFPPDDLDQDIVWCDGFFVRLPELARHP
jgi:hypothetical protein